MKRIRLSILLLSFITGTATAQNIDFHTQVVPVLMKHCYECHGGDQAKGGFSMNTPALWLDKKAAAPGKADKSYFIELIEEKDPDLQMPPKKKPRVAADEVKLLRDWVDQGMKWEEGFTFAKNSYEPPLKPRRPELPKAAKGREHPIDRIIDAYLEQQKIQPQPVLDDAAFYRRVSLDLTGRLPEPDEVAAFVQNKDANKDEALVDQLLSDRVTYARHWLTFWNDLLRNDYKGTGYIDGGRMSISDWLYGSLLENKPYDQFIRELIAPTKESEGFIFGIKWRGTVNASQTPEIQFSQNVGQVFLGINLKCASCHDSFIDRWTLDQTHSLSAIFAQQPLEINRCDKPTGEIARPAWLFPELGDVDPKAPRNERLKQLAALMTSPDNGRVSRTIVNRLWHRMMGRGIVHPVDAMQSEPWSEDLLDYLAVYLVDNKYDLKAVMKHIATSQAYRSRSIALKKEPSAADYRYAGPIIKRMTAEQFVDAIRQVTQTPTTGFAPNFNAIAIEKSRGLESNDKLSQASLLPSDLLQRALGRPNREMVVSSRPQELTTLEALDLANGEALNSMVREGAAKLIADNPGIKPDEVIALVFMRSLSREPSNAELRTCRQMFNGGTKPTGVEDLLWSVFMLPEFQHVR